MVHCRFMLTERITNEIPRYPDSKIVSISLGLWGLKISGNNELTPKL